MSKAATSHGSLRPMSSGARSESEEALHLFDVVRVRQPMPALGLQSGEEGKIVDILDHPRRVYLVDFSGATAPAHTDDVPVHAFSADQLSLVWTSAPGARPR